MGSGPVGIFWDFPTVIHGRASILCDEVRVTKLQAALISALRRMNAKRIDTMISIADRAGYFDGEMILKLDVADGERFRPLNKSHERRLIRSVEKGDPASMLDFSLTIRYRVKDAERHTPRLDRYMIRFIMAEGQMEIHLFHDKGIRRVNPDELIMMLVASVNEELKRMNSSELKVESMHTA